MSCAAVYCDARSENAKSILKASGTVRFVDRPEAADLIWIRKGYRDLQPRITEEQLVNHLPNELTITNKGHLTENLKRHDFLKKRAFSSRDFYQESYCLYLPEERRAFLDRLPEVDSKENLWILKLTGSSRGRGARILWDFRSRMARGEDFTRPPCDAGDTRYIAQRYIKNPLLLEGRKSEMRLYWLVASVDPLLVLMFSEGTVRLNSKPFVLDDFDNTLVHLANVYQQKIHPEYDPSLPLKWSFADLGANLASRGLAPPDFIAKHLRPRLRQCLGYVVNAARGMLTHRIERGMHFGLFGADVMLDAELNPWLTEIQKGPGLSFDDPVKKEVVPRMVREATDIVLEVQRRKRRGESLFGLESVREFEWVIDEA